MSKYRKQSDVVYRCDYHIVRAAKYRFGILTGEVGKLMDKDIRMYSEWLGCAIAELNVQPDHIHVVVGIPPKVSVSAYMGTVKGKTAIKVFKSYPHVEEEALRGQSFSGTGLFCKYGWNK